MLDLLLFKSKSGGENQKNQSFVKKLSLKPEKEQKYNLNTIGNCVNIGTYR